MWWSRKKRFLTVSILGGYGGLGKKRFSTVSTLGGCGGLERSDFQQFLLWVDVVVLEEEIFNSFHTLELIMVVLK